MTVVHDLDQILAASPVLRRCLHGVERAASSEAPILVLGEAGSGRTTLARAIHQASARSKAPLVEVDPAVIPVTLFEADFFGYERGAFTSAAAANPGRIGRARGGSLLLDHVEELPVSTQPKLLRLLAERRYTPLGGEELPADVRFLATAPADLASRVERGIFRADLYYRLEVLAFRLPALKQRQSELPELIAQFLVDLGERFGRPGLRLSSKASRWMFDHPWPGNLRQLRNVLEREVLLRDGEELDPGPEQAEGGAPLALSELEAREIRRALAYTRGHQTRAAQLLGISRKALWEKRRRHGIP